MTGRAGAEEDPRTNLRRHPGVWSALAVAALLLPAGAQARPEAPPCTPEEGQALIDAGRYDAAVREFTCVVDAHPTEVEGYRGRIEANLLLGRYSDAFRDYGRITAFVTPAHPDAESVMVAGYAARLAADPQDVVALTGASFVRWLLFDYAQAGQLLDRLVALRPNDVYANLFRGSSRLLRGGPRKSAEADLDRAIALAPDSPDVHYIVADAYTYGPADFDRAFAEATSALEGGLDTPRVHAILAAALNAFGETAAAAEHGARYFELVTTQLVPTAPLGARSSLALSFVPGQTADVPIPVTAGQTIAIATSSHDYFDSIAVLLAPDGTPVISSDDDAGYHVAFDYTATATGTYRLRVGFFEAVITGVLTVTRR